MRDIIVLGATRQAPVFNERIFDTDDSMVATFDNTDAVPTFPAVPLQIGEDRLDSSTVIIGNLLASVARMSGRRRRPYPGRVTPEVDPPKFSIAAPMAREQLRLGP
jgi:hypothetical protein